LRVCRKFRFLRPEHREERNIALAVVSDSAPDPCGNPNQVAWAQASFDLPIAIGPDAGQLAFEDEEQFFNVGMQVQRTLVAWRENHRAKREVSRLNDFWIIVLTRPAAPHVSHLGAAVFGIDFGLKIEDAPIEFAVFKAGDVFVDVVYRWN
jgi:hypothetical protein